MIATSGFLTALECTEFVFGRGSAPDPTGGAYSAPPDALAGLRSPTSKGEEKGGRVERERKGERKGMGGTGPPFANSWIRHCISSPKFVQNQKDFIISAPCISRF